MVQTYIETNVAQLPEEYSEKVLHRRFSVKLKSLRSELDEQKELLAELEKENSETDWTDPTVQNLHLAQQLLSQYSILERERKPVERMYAETQLYDDLLNEYGDSFAQLYQIKNNHEKRGYVDELSFVEVDITDNGDILTQDQYFKMRADPDGRLHELALHVELAADEEQDYAESIGFNFGVMEFNQPNQPPQTKMQLSFDDETLEQLDEAKLKRIFAFCEEHGISVSDLEIRHFDGSLADDLVREKIENILAQERKNKEESIKASEIKEAAEQEERRKTLDIELQNICAARGGIMPEGLSWEDVSLDKVPENRIMAATNNPDMAPLTREFIKASSEQPAEAAKSVRASDKSADQMVQAEPKEALADNSGVSKQVQIEQKSALADNSGVSKQVQTIAKGVSVAAASEEELQDALIKQPVSQVAAERKKDVVSSDVVTSKSYSQNDAHKNDLEDVSELHSEGNVNNSQISAEKSVHQAQGTPSSVFVPQGTPSQTPPPAENPKINIKKVEETFEKWLENDISKRKGYSYFKKHTGWFGRGWTEYIVYDSEDADNLKKDGQKQKDGSVKYTYSFKLFLKNDKDGNLHFTYRTPNRRKMDEAMIADIVGQLKALGYTHINFPSGIPNAEKALWRKAMAENGIVPINMGLDSHKAGKMIEMAKDKLSAEEFSNYKYKLALQMNRHNRQKGKTVTESEQTFIDGLINSHTYAAFTDAYTLVYKSKIKGLLRKKNADMGAVEKTAAYRTLRKVFDVYKSAIDHGGSLMNAEGLTDLEKQKIRQFGLNGSVSKLSMQQMDQLYEVLFARQYDEAHVDIRDMLLKVHYGQNRGAKVADRILIKAAFDEARESCEGINDDLTAMGIDELKIMKVNNIPFDREFEHYYNVDKPEYERTHPQPGRSTSLAQHGLPMPDISDNIEEAIGLEEKETVASKNKRMRKRSKKVSTEANLENKVETPKFDPNITMAQTISKSKSNGGI